MCVCMAWCDRHGAIINKIGSRVLYSSPGLLYTRFLDFPDKILGLGSLQCLHKTPAADCQSVQIRLYVCGKDEATAQPLRARPAREARATAARHRREGGAHRGRRADRAEAEAPRRLPLGTPAPRVPSCRQPAAPAERGTCAAPRRPGCLSARSHTASRSAPLKCARGR